MKKNYIIPSTEAATWASMGLMQGAITIAVGSAPDGNQHTSNMSDIE